MYFRYYQGNCLEGLEESREMSGLSVSWSRFETGTSRIEAVLTAHLSGNTETKYDQRTGTLAHICLGAVSRDLTQNGGSRACLEVAFFSVRCKNLPNCLLSPHFSIVIDS